MQSGQTCLWDAGRRLARRSLKYARHLASRDNTPWAITVDPAGEDGVTVTLDDSTAPQFEDGEYVYVDRTSPLSSAASSRSVTARWRRFASSSRRTAGRCYAR